MPRRSVLALVAIVVVISGVALWRTRERGRADAGAPAAATVAASYVGSRACAECHAAETGKWQGSQHAIAMAAASAATVLGRFDGVRFAYAGTTSTFLQRDGKFFARTDGPDGSLADFEIRYTIGVAPLQQYLIELPGGRLQPLGMAWDARPASDGGQRWFHLYPRDAIKAGDPLHWTGLRQNANFMCVDCHTTNLRKGYASDTRAFHTTWSEMGAGCEACHGPGSTHIGLARAGTLGLVEGHGLTARLDERATVQWSVDPATEQPARSRPRITEREIEVCARCHARRGQVTEDAKAGDVFENGFRPSVLEPALYFADGQQKDEVYTYGSFLQSKMYAKGVTCSDCHDPHSGVLPLSGNATCTRCHLAAKYDAPGHHFHQPGTAAASCVTCHMPAATFMQIDRRHDHSFRVPRPDRTVSLDVPNACTTACHQGKSAAWAAAAIRQRAGHDPLGFQTFAETFTAADRGAKGASAELLRLASDASQPAIVRASAIARVATADSSDLRALTPLVRDASPIVRRSAASALARADDETRVEALTSLLRDPVRTVRIDAAMSLADIADRALAGGTRAAFDAAFDELVEEQRFNADRPEAQTTLGQVLAERGQLDAALAAFLEAVRLEPAFVPGQVNLADLYRARGDEAAADRSLRAALKTSPASAALHHALGLALVRHHRLPEALTELARAAQIEPANARYAYVHAVALHDSGQTAQAMALLAASVGRHPDSRELRDALESYRAEARTR